jgi:serine/threonine-protein kinase
MRLGVDESFADYTIVRRIGAGGMGEVYLAQHPRLPRRDALKLLSGDVSADPTFRERFLREADLASTLWHPHIVGVHDRGEYQGQLWISMDFVDGEDASNLLASRYPTGMPVDLVSAIIDAVASALDYAHKQGLMHRDIKPANVLLTNIDDTGERRILLTDFGIARTMDDRSGLTATNMTLGTVDYIAPEQLMGEDLDGRADQYSLAATAYHLLTGAALFGYSNAAVVISRHLNTTPPALGSTRPELAAFDAPLAKALSKDPGQRFASCNDFARAFAAHRAGAAAAPTTAAPMLPYQITQVAPHITPGPTPRAGERPAASAPLPAAASTQSKHAVVPGLLWLLGAAVVVLGVITVVLFRWVQNGTSATPTSAAPSTPAAATAPSPTWTSTVTVASSPRVPTPPVVSAPQQALGVVVGTCDEGGSCGVQQRIAPYTSSPRLVPDDLKDGMTVAIECRTSGDVRTSQGHGVSNVWLRLANGAYLNSVYLDIRASWIPTC